MATTTNTKTFTKILASVAALPIALTGLGLTATTASAGPVIPPALEIFEVPDLSDSFELDPNIFDLDLDLFPLFFNPTADVVVDCGADPQVRVDISNTTDSFHWIEVFVDGDSVQSGVVGPDTAVPIGLDFAENDSKEIRVEAGDLTMFDDTVELDCVLSAPSYEILENCDTGQAHARLINLGDDSVLMGVAYPDVMYVQEVVSPHSFIDWLLANPGDGAIAFDIMADDVVIGSEIVQMDCEVPAEPTPEVTPEATPAPEVEAAEENAPIEVDLEEVTFNAGDDDSDPTPTVDPETDADGGSDELAAGVDVEVAPGSGNSPWVALGATMGGLALLAGAAVAWSHSKETVG
jgi:hypothetical protein